MPSDMLNAASLHFEPLLTKFAIKRLTLISQQVGFLEKFHSKLEKFHSKLEKFHSKLEKFHS